MERFVYYTVGDRDQIEIVVVCLNMQSKRKSIEK